VIKVLRVSRVNEEKKEKRVIGEKRERTDMPQP
jgi:hypothetical protein